LIAPGARVGEGGTTVTSSTGTEWNGSGVEQPIITTLKHKTVSTGSSCEIKRIANLLDE